MGQFTTMPGELLLLVGLLASANAVLDAECFLTVPEIARRYGYRAETHIVRTDDEYLLELHRIQNMNSSGGPVVFMQHGLLADGYNFLPNLANESAATVFADAGCDVWIANSRGTPVSQKHIGYGPEDTRFWNFTWQDMSKFDLSASIKYVTNVRNVSDVYYVGHSQGTVIMFAKLSEDQEFAKKIRQFHALAPVATVSHIGGLFRLLGKRTLDVLDYLLHRVPNSPLSMPGFIHKIVSAFCSLPLVQNVCTLDIGVIDGLETMFNMSRVGTYMCHMPAATSIKNLQHWIQIVTSKSFQKFDYGVDGNLAEYGTRTPPKYLLENIRTPTYLYWSRDDILADTDDIRDTILAQMNKTIAKSLELKHYTHLDFVFGLNAANDVYKPIIKEIYKDFMRRQKRAIMFLKKRKQFMIREWQ